MLRAMLRACRQLFSRRASDCAQPFVRPIEPAKNTEILRTLEQWAKPQNKTPLKSYTPSEYELYGYELHTHPDLVEMLRELKSEAPDASFQFVFGVPVLCARNGRIFASAAGTNSMQLYFPGIDNWGAPYPEYGVSWRRGSAWSTREGHKGQIAAMLHLAYLKASQGVDQPGDRRDEFPVT